MSENNRFTKFMDQPIPNQRKSGAAEEHQESLTPKQTNPLVSIKVYQPTLRRLKTLSLLKEKSYAQLIEEFVSQHLTTLSEQEKQDYDMLLKFNK